MRAAHSVLLGLLLVLGAAPAAAKKKPEASAAGPAAAPLFLEPQPTTTGTIRVVGADGAARSAPARVKVIQQSPLRIELEDFDKAEVFEICVQEGSPATFCAAADSMGDTGTFAREGDRLRAELRRPRPDGSTQELRVVVQTAPSPAPRPAAWLQPGTTLFFGRAYDDKPVTKVVPMALTVRMAEASDGSRVFSWTADVDPQRETEILQQRSVSGRRIVKPQVAAAGERHSDAFSLGADVPEDAGSLFLSKAVFANLKKYSGATFADADVPGGSVLVKTGEVDVVVQVDDELWTIHALVASLANGAGIYVIADDPEAPLILSATRPGQRVRLMAMARPAR
jgi:hypothetical protein